MADTISTTHDLIRKIYGTDGTDGVIQLGEGLAWTEGLGGNFLTLGIDGMLSVQLGDSANLDAFSRLRTSNPTTIFSAQCQYDTEPLLFENSGATHSANTRMVAIANSPGSTTFMQSYEYVPYQAGKSQLVLITGLIGTISDANVTVRVGVFDTNNGIFLEATSSGVSLVRRTSTSGSVVNNSVSQGSWNLDTMDGSGASGITFDISKTYVFVIDAQYLGMGRVRAGFSVDGVVVYFHEFLNANTLAVPYMQSLSLPVRMEVYDSTGA